MRQRSITSPAYRRAVGEVRVWKLALILGQALVYGVMAVIVLAAIVQAVALYPLMPSQALIGAGFVIVVTVVPIRMAALAAVRQMVIRGYTARREALMASARYDGIVPANHPGNAIGGFEFSADAVFGVVTHVGRRS